MVGLILVIICIAVVVYAIYYSFQHAESGRKELADLKQQYDKALKSGDRKTALEAGRKYYSTLRGGTLSIYDEQAITNDLSAM